MSNDKIIIEFDNEYVRYGFAGYDAPFGQISSRLQYDENFVLVDTIDIDGFKIMSPIKNNIIVDMDKMKYIWDEIFYNKLKINTKMCYILVCDPLFNGEANKEELSKIFLDDYKFKGVLFFNKQILALYGVGKNRGLVIDLGCNSTKIVPIYENYILFDAIIITDAIDSDNISEICDSIIKSINLSPIDFRKIFYQNMLIIGKNSVCNKGELSIGKKIIKNIKNKLNLSLKLKISSPKNRIFLPWLGGSILCGMQSITYMWVDKK